MSVHRAPVVGGHHGFLEQNLGPGTAPVPVSVDPVLELVPRVAVSRLRDHRQPRDRLAQRNYGGIGTTIVVSVSEATRTFADAAREVVNERSDPRVYLWNYAHPALDRLGCDWHFSAWDHRLVADKLRDYLAGLSLCW